MARLTVFTPTYNRATTLERLYYSLCNQSSQDFVWLIVDDGSTDGTRELVNSFAAEGKICISYIFQENGGKHRAHNVALSMTKTPLFFCVDSDDMLTENAIERILCCDEENSGRNLLGYYFRKGDLNGRTMGTGWPEAVDYAPIMDLYDRYNFFGDTAIVLYTKKVSGVCFPVFEQEKFVTEAVFYSQLNNVAPMAYINEVIYLCEYRDDGYTKNANKLAVSNPYGTAMGFLSYAVTYHSPLKKAKRAAQFLAWCYVFDINKFELGDMQKRLSVTVAIFGWLICPHYVRRFKKLRENNPL